MAIFPLSLKTIAYAYCRFVVQHAGLLGIDGYQRAVMVAVLAILGGVAFLASGRAQQTVNRFCPPWLYCLLLIGALFIARLPTFQAGVLNADEAMLLAGAMKLRHYPVFWQSLDGTTSGPLNYYALTLLNVLGLTLDFATARLLNVFCMGGAIAVVYRVARLFMADWPARLTPLPALAAAMAFRGPDLLHYSSECVSVLLIACGVWLLFAEAAGSAANWRRGAGIGVIAALIPLAKLQAAPVAAAIAAAGMAHALFWRRERNWRQFLSIFSGSACVISGLLLFLAAFGVFGAFFESYIVTNYLYANLEPALPLKRFIYFCLRQDLHWYEAGIVGWLGFAAAIAYIRWSRREADKNASGPAAIIGRLPFLDLFVLALVAASVFAIYRPHRAFPHYLIFLIFPLALAGARALAWTLQISNAGTVHQTRAPMVRLTATRAAVCFVMIAVALPFLGRARTLRPGFESQERLFQLRDRWRCPACPLMNQFVKAGDPVTIWGWSPELYVFTGTIPATRDPQTPYVIKPGLEQDYYRRRYLEDLRLHPPKLFVDAVGPGNFAFRDRAAEGFETIPELRRYVTSNFYLAGDVHGVRVFARRDAKAVAGDGSGQ